jgi:nanoRNase/pAp phosphatase (c-di-AMP/oligoRNAs hydrolase)
MIYSVQKDWSVKCSVRSVEGGKMNARQVAERFQGGGHDNAAGCRFESMAEFRKAVDDLTGNPSDV